MPGQTARGPSARWHAADPEDRRCFFGFRSEQIRPAPRGQTESIGPKPKKQRRSSGQHATWPMAPSIWPGIVTSPQADRRCGHARRRDVRVPEYHPRPPEPAPVSAQPHRHDHRPWAQPRRLAGPDSPAGVPRAVERGAIDAISLRRRSGDPWSERIAMRHRSWSKTPGGAVRIQEPLAGLDDWPSTGAASRCTTRPGWRRHGTTGMESAAQRPASG